MTRSTTRPMATRTATGRDQNLSWNCGVEGPTTDPAVEALRRRQAKNLLAIDLLAVGTPMLLMGDEVRRSQGGNNNAYCHDDPTAWFDWSDVERHAEIHRFTRSLIRIRKHVASVLDIPDDAGLLDLLAQASLQWGGTRVGQPDLGDDSHSVDAHHRHRPRLPASHLQCLLGAARLRPAGPRRGRRRLATDHRHQPRRARRRRHRLRRGARRSRGRPITPSRARW